MNTLEKYFSGEVLIGDDYCNDELAAWYEDEKEGYANLGARNQSEYTYKYNALNKICAFNHIDLPNNCSVLGFGAAYGDELVPIVDKASFVYITDPSDEFRGQSHPFLGDVKWLKTNILNTIDLKDNTLDCITCLGVLHHIPNVSSVVAEMYRVLKPGGILVVREPIVSMGDWRNVRPGLTKRERGIPLKVFKNIISETKFTVLKRSLCLFSGFQWICHKMFGREYAVYNNNFLTRVDMLLCFFFSFRSKSYHRTNKFSKFGPTNVYFVLRK